MNPVSEDPDREYLEFARAAFEHRECRTRLERDGFDVTAVRQADGVDSVRCPHGVWFWLVPE